MTVEEAIARIADHMVLHGIGRFPHIETAEAFYLAIETLEKVRDGKMIELPCKIGDIFYGIQGDNVFEYECLSMKLGDSNSIILVTAYDMEFSYGEEAFLSKEEAEKALKER